MGSGFSGHHSPTGLSRTLRPSRASTLRYVGHLETVPVYPPSDIKGLSRTCWPKEKSDTDGAPDYP